jgi:DNA modification methylase
MLSAPICGSCGETDVDVVVLDPPYAHDLGTHMLRENFNRGAANMTGQQIRALYRDGMAEAKRVLKPGGLLWVKCKDGVECGQQRWQHVEVYNDALALGFVAKDLLVVVTPARLGRWDNQHSARKNHSFMWIFEKGKRAA